MGRTPKARWTEDKKIAEDKTLEKIEPSCEIQEISKISIGEEVEPEPTVKSHRHYSKDVSEQAVPVSDKKKMPKITISYYNKENQLIIREYICAHVDINQDQRTVLEGVPTGRKDYLHMSIDAQVVKIVE